MCNMQNHLWFVLYALTFLWICAMGFTAFGRMPDKVRGGMAARLTIYGVILCGLAVAISQVGCSRQPPTPATHAPLAREARNGTVVIMCLTTDYKFPDMSHEVDSSGGLDVQLVPCCSGFVAATKAGPRILTAAHCVKSIQVGHNVAYVTRHDWNHTSNGYNIATLASTDVHDRAVLLPKASDVLPEPLELGYCSPGSGDFLRSVSQEDGFKEITGNIVGDSIGNIGAYYVTTLDVVHGWSGSPVLDAHGHAIGLVVSCGVNEAVSRECMKHSGNFVGLAGMGL